MTYSASCACGAVQLVAEGEPVVQAYCHCTTCRGYSGMPVTAAVLWPRAMVRFTKGEDHVCRYSPNDHPEGGRLSCGLCHGLIGSVVADAGLIDIFAGVIKDFDFQPTVHVNYETASLRIRDGLPKFKDMPERSGGTGELLPE